MAEACARTRFNLSSLPAPTNNRAAFHRRFVVVVLLLTMLEPGLVLLEMKAQRANTRLEQSSRILDRSRRYGLSRSP